MLLWRIFWLGGPLRVLKLVENPGLLLLVIVGIFGVTADTVEEN